MWTPNKQFCFSKSAPFRVLSPHSKLWYHICSHVIKQWWTWSCGFNVTCSRSQRYDCSSLPFLFCFSPPHALFRQRKNPICGAFNVIYEVLFRLQFQHHSVKLNLHFNFFFASKFTSRIVLRTFRALFCPPTNSFLENLWKFYLKRREHKPETFSFNSFPVWKFGIEI